MENNFECSLIKFILEEDTKQLNKFISLFETKEILDLLKEYNYTYISNFDFEDFLTDLIMNRINSNKNFIIYYYLDNYTIEINNDICIFTIDLNGYNDEEVINILEEEKKKLPKNIILNYVRK